MTRGPMIIVSGPSGSGKSTAIARVLRQGDWPLHLSVSATTRQPRPGEVDGVHYFFWPRERFEEQVEAGAFLEWAQVHGQLYGTLKSEVENYRSQGIGVILDIDVQGADQVRSKETDAVSIFFRAPSLDELERRLRGRGTEDENAIRRRLDGARRELARAADYDYQVVNEDLDRAVEELALRVGQAFERRR